jgi:hypothetical protein
MAFMAGQWVAIRTQVRPDHPDAINCIRCWSPEREEATDPTCPVCQGSGWISQDTYTGYRLRIFAQAQIPETVDQYYPTRFGLTDKVETRFWVNFTERPLADGDLIAHVVVNDVDNPEYIVSEIRRFEVIESLNPQLHPGVNTQVHSDLIVAQDVRADQLNIDRPEMHIDMDENIVDWQISWEYPQSAVLHNFMDVMA